MRDKTIRTVGATVVLLGVAIAALMQSSARDESEAVAIVTDDPVATSTSPSSVASTAAPEPFVYRVGVLAGLSAQNFWDFYGSEPSVWNSYILGPTKPALYGLDGAGGITSEVATDLATPTPGADGWHVQVDLRDDMTWSDGTPITAHDYVFTYETVRSLELTGSWAKGFPASIESVVADSDYELRIEFAARPSLSVWPHGAGLVPLMPAHVWEEHTKEATASELYAVADVADVGGGPLTVSSISEDLIVSHANRGYGEAANTPDSVEYHVFADADQATEALADGAIDTILTPKGLTSEQVGHLDGNPNVSIEASPANGVRYLGFNLARAPMDQLAFREALALLVDRDDLAAKISPSGESTYSFVSSANRVWYDTEAAASNEARYQGSLNERLAASLEGLRQVGYAWTTEPSVDSSGAVVPGEGLTIDGQAPAPLTILTTGDIHDPWRPEYASSIATTLEWLGFDARPVETDFDTVVDLAFTPGDDGALHYDMYLLGWTLGNPLLPGYYRTMFSADGEMNNTGYSSSAFEELLQTFEASYTVDEARESLWAMENQLAADLPYLLLYSTAITEVYRSDRVAYAALPGLGGLQAALGGIAFVNPVDS